MSFLRIEPFSLYHTTILLYLWLMLIHHVYCQTIPSSNISCIDSERRALLTFKKSLDISSKHNLSSWNPENMDCCRWEGIRCNKARHVVALDLRGTFDAVENDYVFFISGEISSSLLRLSYLNYLDLSSNRFTKVPEFVGSFKRLRYLNLSYNSLTGKFPYHLGNLSALETLDIQTLAYGLQVDSLRWVSKLTSLEYLDLSYISLDSTKDWLQSISSLPSLKRLYLRHNDLRIPPPIQINASTSLVVVHFSGAWDLNFLDLSPLLNGSTKLVDLSIQDLVPPNPIPDYLLKLVSIKYLDLSKNNIEEMPKTFSNLSNLITLDVSWNMLNKSVGFLQSGSNSLQELRVNDNQLQGALPNFSKFPSLQVLRLERNEFKGGLAQLLQQSTNLIYLDASSNNFSETLTGIPFSKFSALQVLNLAENELEGSLGQLIQQSPNLIKLDVSSNHFSGTLTEAHFRNLTNLKFLSLSFNSLTLRFSTGFTPSFQLETLSLSECNLGKIFPHWLRTQSNLTNLEISNSGISDTVPSWFWNISSRLSFLNVSHNSMSGSIPPNSLSSCDYINLCSNQFHGTLPSFSKILQFLDVSNNSFSGGITFLCGLKGWLFYLNLSNNLFSGILPNCFYSLGKELSYLNLENNKFTGPLPNSIGSSSGLLVLRLRNNSFSGKLSQSLVNCTVLILLDLGENHFSGTIPDWIGTNLTGLVVLRLRSNKFEGNIPSSLCHLDNLQILDLSFNNISGIIPLCLNNITSMINRYESDDGVTVAYTLESEGVSENSMSYSYSTWVFWKGFQLEYKNTKGMEILRYIDFSNNRLSGSIPEELTSLVELDVLSLSHNVLIGPIPSKIGNMRLETLDLSHNLISGEIPSSMSDMFTLNYLDLSYNSLMGRIPDSTQLSTIDATMFVGNPGLCGDPLSNSCHQGENVNNDLPSTQGENVKNDLPSTEGGDDNENMWMYISIVLGFIIGFWGVCGTLVVKHSWAQKYFQFLTHIQERLHVIILIWLASLRRRFRS